MTDSQRRPGRQDQATRFALSGDARLRRLALLSVLGLSFVAPLASAGQPAFGSAAWLAQKGAQQPVSPTAPSGGNAGSGAVTSPTQAYSQAQQSLADLSGAMNAIVAAQRAQAQAAGQQISVAAQPGITDGLGSGLLDPNNPQSWIGASAPTCAVSACGVDAKGQVTVNVTQNQQRAVLDWNSFNVGAHTTLNFDQSQGTQKDGTNNWVALNRVDGGGVAQIMGSIKAQGDVYIIDGAGILFGAGSKIDTHSLLVSTLDFMGGDVNVPGSMANAANAFVNGGLTAVSPVLTTPVGADGVTPKAAGSITIAKGASINTGELGFALLAAPDIENHGQITATDGQVILAAGNSLSLDSGSNAQGQFTPRLLPLQPGQAAELPTGKLYNDGIVQAVRGNVTLLGLDIEQDGIVGVTTSITRPGSIIIKADESSSAASTDSPDNVGTVVFGNGSVTTVLPSDDGETTTSSTAASGSFKPGSILISGGAVTFQAGSLVEAPGASVSVSAIQGNIYYNADDLPGTYGRVYVAGAELDPSDPTQTRTIAGAIIDVAGLADVVLPASSTMVTIGPLTANDLADSPLLRDGFLFSQTVTVDSTLSGTRADGTPWVGSPLIDAAGYIQAVPRTVDQMLVDGGSINLSGHEVITGGGISTGVLQPTKGSILNLDGGYVDYQGGMVAGQTLLEGADGRLYSIGDADPNVEYVGFAGSYSTNYARWNKTDTWVDPLLSGSLSHYEPEFVQGGNAGKLNITVSALGSLPGNGTLVLDGSISAQAVAGRNQVASGGEPSGGSFSVNSGILGGGPSFFITNTNLVLPQGFDADTALPIGAADPKQAPDSADPNSESFDLGNWSPINGTALAGAGFSNISLNTPNGQIVVPDGASLSVTPSVGSATAAALGSCGGSCISLNAASVTVDGDLTAHSGSIIIQTSGQTSGPTFDYDPTDAGKPPIAGDIRIGDNAHLDVSGLWVNDTGLGPEQISGSAFVNGGKIELITHQAEESTTLGGTTQGVDTTGGIYIGGVLDVSSGGYIGTDGVLASSGGVPLGKAGNIALDTYDSSSTFFGIAINGMPLPAAAPTTGTIELGENADLIGYGFTQGGSLTIRTLGIVIGPDGGQTADGQAVNLQPWQLYLGSSFFSGRGGIGTGQVRSSGRVEGFGSYTLESEYDTTVLAGTTINLQQQNLLPDYAALAGVATGTSASALRNAGVLGVGTLDPYHRSPTNLTIVADDYFNWAVAAGVLPPQVSGLATGTLLVGESAQILGDPGASIVLGSPGTVEVLGRIAASGGSISLNGLSPYIEAATANQSNLQNTYAAQSVVLGSNAVLDTSGTVLTDPYVDQAPGNSGQSMAPLSGKVLNGGSVSITGDDIIALKASGSGSAATTVYSNPCGGGACIDVAGASGTLDLPQAGGSYAPQTVWSDAGSVTLAAVDGIYFDGSIRAAGGSGAGGAGQGGTLNLYALNADGIILRQGGDALPAGYDPGQGLPPSQNGDLQFAVGSLGDWGVASLNLGSGIAANAVTHKGGGVPESAPTAIQPIRVGFAGDVDLNLNLSFTADATNYVALADGATSFDPANAPATNTTIKIDAPYVALNGYYRSSNAVDPVASPFTATAGPSSLDVNASFIDFGGDFSLDNLADAHFSSSGDIRFVTPAQFDFAGISGSNTAERGGLVMAGTTGTLYFTARELYPASGSSFAVLANAIDVEQAKDANGNPVQPVVPLSAGGSLLLDAAQITQNGTLWAPAGSIVIGVGNVSDKTIDALFNPPDSVSGTPLNTLGLIATQSVDFGAGSTTSVSLGGMTLPYGTTLDGKEWQYNSDLGVIGVSQPDLTAPPAKLIQVQGASISADAKAVMDLSGGGELQAIEWVPGTGGTRDVLSQFNISYATNSAGTQVPLYPDARGVYALVPSYEAPVAAYDPVFAQGQAAIGLGQAVYLSGAPGIAAGTYVLLPAKYATLKGAFRVVQDSGAIDSLAADNSTAPDGTQFVEGYYVNTLDGARAARTTTFELQSAPVWGQYSDYLRTSADSFFPALAAQSGTAVPQLPRDAGQLILGASTSLDLGKGFLLDTAAGSGGAQASIDIASQNIEVVGSDAQLSGLAPGTLGLTVEQLNDLHAGSLLLGGTRSQTSAGTSIDALASSITVDDAGSVLQAPEVLLVAHSGGGSIGTIDVTAGSHIAASGTVAAGADRPLSIAGGGALLMVSNGQPVALTRSFASGDSHGGLLQVGAGAELDGGNSLLLDSTNNTLVDGSAKLSGSTIAADAGSIVFFSGATAPAGASGLLIGPDTLAQFAGANRIDLRSYSGIDFEANDPGNEVKIDVKGTLALSAGGFTDGAVPGGNAGNVSLSAGTLILGNELGASQPTAAPAGSSSLNLNAAEIDFGYADAASSSPAVKFSGFGSVQATATSGIVGQNNSFDFGGIGVALNAPIVLAASNANTTLTTTGALSVSGNGGKALDASGQLGGQLELDGGSVTVAGLVEANAGNLLLSASTGNVEIQGGGALDVAGVAKTFFDVSKYAPGGNIGLAATHGSVLVDSGATLDFSGAQPAANAVSGGSDAGALSITSMQTPLIAAGTLKGDAPTGFTGGSFSLDTSQGSFSLDSLVAALPSSSTSPLGAVSVHTGVGDLELSGQNQIDAGQVLLVADAGTVKIDAGAAIRADGAGSGADQGPGGSIALYGQQGVDLEGTLSATTANPGQRGGTVQLGTGITGTPDPTKLNGQYGYENIDPSQSGTLVINGSIDVSGGSAAGHTGGIIELRAPLLDNGDVNLQVGDNARINTGGGSFSLEPYAVWSTTDKSSGAQHFDGVIDPAGWFSSTGTLVAGVFTDQDGNVVLNYDPGMNLSADQIETLLANDFFTPDAGAVNTDHQGFYTGTLAAYVENPGYSAALQQRASAAAGHGATLTVTPGIELDAPSQKDGTGGDIKLLSNWNLGACDPCTGANPGFLYRYQGQAPVLTLRAGNNLDVEASLSDGFTQLVAGPNLNYSVAAAQAASTQYNSSSAQAQLAIYAATATIKVNGSPVTITTDTDYIGFTMPMPGQSAIYYSSYQAYITKGVSTWASLESRLKTVNYTVKPSSIAAGAPSTTEAQANWAQYVADYQAYLAQLTTAGGTPQPPQLPSSAAAYANTQTVGGASVPSYLALWQQYESKVATLDGISPIKPPTTLLYYIYPPLQPAFTAASLQSVVAAGNDAANVRSIGNVAPLAYATLAGGNSSSYRLVAGAAFASDGTTSSADPLAVQVAPSAGGGSVLLGGYGTASDQLTSYAGGGNPELAFPTVIRTGTGAIAIAAAGDLTQDAQAGAVAPAAIYTAGAPDNGVQNGSVSLLHLGTFDTANNTSSLSELIVTGAVNPEDAGDISIHVGGNINAAEFEVDSTGQRTGITGEFIGQLWIPWLESGNSPTASSINFGSFDQGVLSDGGNVSISAGGNITDLSVSLPTTWRLDSSNTLLPVIGGGNLDVSAGGDIFSGTYFVSKGQGSISAGGQIGASADSLISFGQQSSILFQSSLSTLLGLQDAQMTVQARQGIDLGGVYDPSYLSYSGPNIRSYFAPDSQGYSVNSSLTAQSTAGDVQLDTFTFTGRMFGGGSSSIAGANVLPATLDLTALDGGIGIHGIGALAPSPSGELSLVADQSISFTNDDQLRSSKGYFGMIDADTMPSPGAPIDTTAIPFGLAPAEGGGTGSNSGFAFHQPVPLHADDQIPVRIYSLEGSIVDGEQQASGFYGYGLQLVTAKQTMIQAGQDIVDLNFAGQNLGDDDVTRILAGRDIYDTPLPSENLDITVVPSLQLGGPGTFDIEAGRNIGPLASQVEAINAGYFFQANIGNVTGIDTVGNDYNPYLAHQSASISLLFGIAPGIDASDFIARYIAPGASVKDVPSYTPALVSFMEQYDEGKGWDSGLLKDQKNVTLSSADAWTEFQALPGYVQQLFVEQVFNDILFRTGQDFHDPSSPEFEKYARGYDAINTLFPASLGYTQNSLDGGSNGSNAPKSTGDLDVRGSTIQTEQGGNISLFGPGGSIVLASASAPPFVVDRNGNAINTPNTEGVLTLEQGNVDIFADGSVLLAQSRIFTEQGGDMLIWSSNGDISAGSGTKTTAFVPPLKYVCDPDAFCIVDPSGEVTGAGIATLQTVPDAPPGDVELVAPRGTVDAGAAGIRVSGNLVIAALAVANAFNIQVKGSSVGVPTVARVDTSALNAANSATAAAEDASALSRHGPDAGSQIDVEVVGFGAPDEEQKKRLRRQNHQGDK